MGIDKALKTLKFVNKATAVPKAAMKMLLCESLGLRFRDGLVQEFVTRFSGRVNARRVSCIEAVNFGREVTQCWMILKGAFEDRSMKPLSNIDRVFANFYAATVMIGVNEFSALCEK